MPKPRVILVNQYCYPDVASTGHLIHTLAHELARDHGFEVEVLTTQPSYGDKDTWVDMPRVVREDGVTFRRVWVPRLSKNILAGRAIKDLVYMIQLGVRALFGRRRNTVYLYTTAPPYAAFVGAVCRLLRRQVYCTLLYDAYPQIGVWVGTFKKNGVIECVWHWVNRRMYKGAAGSIVLCKAASRLLVDTYPIDPEQIRVIPNWADGDKLFPVPKRDTNFAKTNEFVEPFTLLYSGNMGLYYEFETVLKAAEMLADEPFRLVLVGGGGRKAWCEQEVERRGLQNTKIFNYQPFETLNDSLNACDASLVTIAEGIEGISFPSKLYTSLAVGKAIVAISEPDSELRDIVAESACGVWAALGDADGLVELLRGMMREKTETDRMGEAARELFEQRYTRQVCAAQYASMIRDAGERAGVYRKDD
ncbi:MAG: glycosyltransferase family 4 protein [Phycisphaerales bacterium]